MDTGWEWWLKPAIPTLWEDHFVSRSSRLAWAPEQDPDLCKKNHRLTPMVLPTGEGETKGSLEPRSCNHALHFILDKTCFKKKKKMHPQSLGGFSGMFAVCHTTLGNLMFVQDGSL